MNDYFKRIEFWIILFLLVRLIGITNPPLEKAHNWRQVTGLMVARNYLEVDPNIMYPRIDDNNGGSGIIGMEFPSLNYVHFLTANIFGYTHWYGRLINLLVSSLGLFFFYKLINLAGFKERIAFVSTIFLATSIWFSFSRKMMPDTYCISIMFVGLYYGLKYLQEHKVVQIIAFTLCCSLAILSKIPAGIYLVVLAPFLLSTKFRIKEKLILSACTIIPLTLTYLWYFQWNFKLADRYGNWYNSGKPLSVGFSEIIQHLDQALEKFYFSAFSSYFMFILFALGLIFMIYKKEKKLVLTFVLTFLVFIVYIFKSGFFFYHHSYYIIPFVPVMALVAGYFVSLIKKQWIFLSVILIGVGESIANQQHDLFIKNSQKYKAQLEPIMDKVSEKEDLILINGDGNPQLMYMSHRKGWNCSNQKLSDTSYIKKVIENGCKFIVVDKKSYSNLNELNLPYKTAFENDYFIIKQVAE